MLALPDPGQTAANWKTTDLYKIWTEPEVQAFLAKPLARIPPDQQRTDFLAQVTALAAEQISSSRSPPLDEKSNEPHLVGGFQFKGTSAEVDHLIAPAKDGWRQKYPAGKADLINYQGHSLETFDTGDGTTIASAYLGDWYLLANDVALLKTTIDRVDHRLPANSASLEQEPGFRAVSAKLPGGYDSLIYAQVQPLVARMLALAAASGQPVDEEARQEMEKGRAFGATTKIENGKIRDSIYYLAPGLRQDFAHLQMGSVGLTSADTLLYFASAFHLPDHLFPAQAAGSSAQPANVAALLQMIQPFTKGITPELVHAALGSELAFHLDWPVDRAQPTAVWSIDVRDRAAAEKLINTLASATQSAATWQIKKAGALDLYVLSIPGLDALKPTLAVTTKI